jgi:17beta-estradiol 17-dehydrogenase / very-long-chain 3-oxoacyl-CoA reductase
MKMGSNEVLSRQQEPAWFVSLAILGALYVAAVAFRILSHLVLLLPCRPTDLRRRYGAWALVTGPTSGIGQSVALELARRGLNLVLVGRDPAKLQDMADTISNTNASVQTKTVVVDLALIATPQGPSATTHAHTYARHDLLAVLIGVFDCQATRRCGSSGRRWRGSTLGCW